ncbi:MAG: DUF1573 domain-containing protein [Acidobacteriota bacterium]
MRRLTPILMILAPALLLTGGVVATEGGGSQPLAVPVEPIKDFDVVAKGEVIEHVFEIKNEGTSNLELTDVRPACGCTVADYDKSIAPGATGSIHTTVKTDHFAGPISKSIAVFTNDPANPKIQLVVKAKIKPYISMVPGFARYNYVQGEDSTPIYQNLWADDGTDVNIVSAKAPYPHLKVSYREATEEELNPKGKGKGKQWRFAFHLQTDSPVGALRDYVTIEVDHPKQRFLKIPISGFVRPRQHVTPPNVDFGNLESEGLPLRRTLHFTNFITDSIELTKVETDISGLQAEVTAGDRDPGYRFKLVLTLGPEMPKGRFVSTVKIHTTDEQNPIIELPVRGTIL